MPPVDGGLEILTDEFSKVVSGSPEDLLRASDGSGLSAGAGPGETSGAIPPAEMGKQEALKRFTVDLTEKARKGDKAALNELCRRAQKQVFAVAREVSRNDEDAEDAMQDAFLVATMSLATFKVVRAMTMHFSASCKKSFDLILMKLRVRLKPI